jgi:hypothetical protein
MDMTCMGCIGSKGEKFCTKPTVGFGELNTCGVNAHSKKAITTAMTLYFVV